MLVAAACQESGGVAQQRAQRRLAEFDAVDEGKHAQLGGGQCGSVFGQLAKTGPAVSEQAPVLPADTGEAGAGEMTLEPQERRPATSACPRCRTARCR